MCWVTLLSDKFVWGFFIKVSVSFNPQSGSGFGHGTVVKQGRFLIMFAAKDETNVTNDWWILPWWLMEEEQLQQNVMLLQQSNPDPARRPQEMYQPTSNCAAVHVWTEILNPNLARSELTLKGEILKKVLPTAKLFFSKWDTVEVFNEMVCPLLCNFFRKPACILLTLFS